VRGYGAVLEGGVRRGRRIGCRAECLVGAQAGFGGMGGWMDGRGCNGGGRMSHM